jgi:ADP-ribose pyrophosphatase YjhB (NUDIX family)
MPASTDAHAWTEDLYALADELRSIASEGLQYARDAYDVHRYERLLRSSAALLAVVERRPATAILDGLQGDLHQVTPLVGVDAMVVESGRVLLIQRSDNHLWCMPGGAVEVGETVAAAAERELREEAGVEGKARRVAALLDSRLWHSGVKRHMVHIVLLMERISGEPTTSSESLAVGYFAESELPALSYGHRDWLRPLLARLREGEPTALFDA